MPVKMSQNGHFVLKPQFQAIYDRNVSEAGIATLRMLGQRLDANDKVTDLAVALPPPCFDQFALDKIVKSRDPGESLLRKMGVRDFSVKTLIDALCEIKELAGLSLFCNDVPLSITRVPDSNVVLVEGERLELHCEATGLPPPMYQWYKGNIPMRSSSASTSKLVVDSVTLADNGRYSCLVSQDRMAQQQRTHYCIVVIHPRPIPVPSPAPMAPPTAAFMPSYTAKDKLALLIGNNKYAYDRELKAPANDIMEIGVILEGMGFKVVTCRDLAKTEMETVILAFTDLLNDGIYGVFYFAGHGFEDQQGTCYLVPSDAPKSCAPETCVDANRILADMQDGDPGLCAVMLDICRENKAEGCGFSAADYETHPPGTRGNSVLAYSTSYGKKAYEVDHSGSSTPGAQLSIFAEHLLSNLDAETDVVSMLRKAVESVGNDKRVHERQRRPGMSAPSGGSGEGNARLKQIPEIRFTLNKSRSLHDPVEGDDGCIRRSKVAEKAVRWDATHLPPSSTCEIAQLEDISIAIKCYFSRVHSNTLRVYIVVVRRSTHRSTVCADKVKAWVVGVPPRMVCDAHELANTTWPACANNAVRELGGSEVLMVSRNDIGALQRVRQSLEVNIKVTGVDDDGRTVDMMFREEFGVPLIADMGLSFVDAYSNMGVNLMPPRNPTEHEEESATQA